MPELLEANPSSQDASIGHHVLYESGRIPAHMYDATLVPTDGSDTAVAAVDDALDVTAPDGTLHALGVLEDIPMYKNSGTPTPDENDDTADRERLEASIDQITDAAEAADIECVPIIEEGVPSHEIVRYADEAGVDAIVMGKRSMRDAAGDLLGSTTERVIQNAATTVVAVPVGE